nr:MAG TPA: hypothetical protein [Caudoviricetes sp.]
MAEPVSQPIHDDRLFVVNVSAPPNSGVVTAHAPAMSISKQRL